MPGLERVFVYGTLMRDQANAAVAARAGLVAAVPARVEGFVLVHLEPEGYPAVVPGRGVVHGEVLQLEGPLDELDRLEGLHETPPLYRRVRCRPVDLDPAWIYVYARPERLDQAGVLLLPGGRWTPTAYES